MKRVLLVEDHPGIALALGVRLKSMGYQVSTATDAVAAVSQVRKLRPDVVILDVGMPAGDGFLVSERISRLRADATAPIIFVTASQKPGLQERALALGAAGFLRKPFDATALADAIETVLSPGNRRQPLGAAS